MMKILSGLSGCWKERSPKCRIMSRDDYTLVKNGQSAKTRPRSRAINLSAENKRIRQCQLVRSYLCRQERGIKGVEIKWHRSNLDKTNRIKGLGWLGQ
jgi:hypothetical protein